MSAGLDRAERGTLYPERLPAAFRRLEPERAHADLVRWWWISTWDLPGGTVSRQRVLPFPASNLVVEHDLVGLAGPSTQASHRDLRGAGWAVGALLQPASVPAVVGNPRAIRNEYRILDEPNLHAAVTERCAAGGLAAGTESVAVWLRDRVGEPDDEGRLANRLVEVFELAPEVDSVERAAEVLGVSVRTLHRLAERYVGLTPYAMIRRRRLQDAAHRLRRDRSASIAEVAAEHGFTDHAHFTREFRGMLGESPSMYRDAVVSGA